MRSMSVDVAKTVVHVFILSRLDYCNSLLYDISDILPRCLQALILFALFAGMILDSSGSVAEWLRRWTRNSEVASSIPGRGAVE